MPFAKNPESFRGKRKDSPNFKYCSFTFISSFVEKVEEMEENAQMLYADETKKLLFGSIFISVLYMILC